MMQLWFSSSEMTAVSAPMSGTSVETIAAYAELKIIAASRPWNAARRASSATCGSYVPLMKRTAPGPQP